MKKFLMFLFGVFCVFVLVWAFIIGAERQAVVDELHQVSICQQYPEAGCN